MMQMQYAAHTPSGLFLCAFCDMGFMSKPECLAHMQCHLQNDRNDNHPQQHQQMMIQELPEPQIQEQVHTIVTNHHGQQIQHHQIQQQQQQQHEQTHMVQVEAQEHVGTEQVAVVRIYVCGNCKSTFFQESDLAQHMTSHQQYRCNICYGLFESEGHLNQHKMIHKQQTIENNVVLSNIPPIAGGHHHAQIIQHSGTGDLMRTVTIQQNSPRRMTPRRQDTTKDRPFSCDECGKSYVTKGVLGQHKMTHRGLKPHTCEICNRGFYNKGHLNKHLLIHKGERPFPCSLCNKKFRAKGDRESHMVTHTKVRNYECTDCGKTFLQSSHRAQHWRLHHSGEEARIYQCDQCEKSFRNPGNLIQHKMFHKGVRAHKCTECDKAFVMRYDLKKHMRTHTGEKPYVCNVCDRAFARKATMDVHVKKMHTDKKNAGMFVKKPYGCDLCPKKFRKRTLLGKHKKRIHGGEDLVIKSEGDDHEESKEDLDDSVESESDNIITEGEIKQVHIVETADGESVPVISAEDITIVAGVVDDAAAEIIEALPTELQQEVDNTQSVQPMIAMEVIPVTVQQAVTENIQQQHQQQPQPHHQQQTVTEIVQQSNQPPAM